jgi:hypothetical protein
MNADRDIRELLQAKAGEVPPSAGIPRAVLQRSKRRRVLTTLAVSMVIVMAGAGTLAGVRAMTERPRFDPVRPGPSRTDRDSSERRDSAVVNLEEMAMTEVSDGDRPDGSSWFLRIGRSGNKYCAELLPEGDSGCWTRKMTTDRFPVDLMMQGTSSNSRHQYVLGVVDSEVARVVVRSKGGYSAEAMTSPGPPQLRTDVRFFVAFAPKKSAGQLTGYDRAGNEKGRLRFTRVPGAGVDGCGDNHRSRGSSAGARTLPLPNLGPVELLAMSFTTIITGEAAECSMAVEFQPPRRTGSSNR